jgi:PAS domain S-box-containing protein
LAEQTARLLERAEEADGPVAVTRLITDHAVDGIFLLGPDGRTTFANPAAVAMFGWSLDELRRHKLHDLIHHQHPDGRAYPMSDCPLGRVFETGESLRLHEDVFFRRDGQAVHVACSNAAIVSGGSVMGGVLIVRDVRACCWVNSTIA